MDETQSPEIALKRAREHVNAEITRLEKANDPDLKRSGALNAAIGREMTTAAEGLIKEIRTFTEKADKGTNRLAFWTMFLGIVTGLLAIAAFVEAFATLLGK